MIPNDMCEMLFSGSGPGGRWFESTRPDQIFLSFILFRVHIGYSFAHRNHGGSRAGVRCEPTDRGCHRQAWDRRLLVPARDRKLRSQDGGAQLIARIGDLLMGLIHTLASTRNNVRVPRAS